MVDLLRFWPWLINVTRGALFDREKVCTEYHLPKAFVVHELEAGSLLGRVDIGPLVVDLNLFLQIALGVVHRQQFFMETLLLGHVLQFVEHLF